MQMFERGVLGFMPIRGRILIAFCFVVVFMLPIIGNANPSDPLQGRSHAPGNTSWTGYQNTLTHNAVFPGSRLKVAWQTLLGDKVNGGLAIVDGIMYAPSFDHTVYAISIANGYTIWRTTLPNVTMTTPVIADGIVIVGTGTNMLLNHIGPHEAIWGTSSGDGIYALSAKDGHLLWKFKTIGEDMPSAFIYHGMVVFVNGDMHAYALNLHTGRLIWKVRVMGNAAMSNAEIHNGTLFATDCETGITWTCETRAIDVWTGATRWINPIGSQEATPTIANGLVYISQIIPAKGYEPGGPTIVAAISERTGKTIWKRLGPSGPCTDIATNVRQVSATVVDGMLLQPFGCTHRLWALNAKTGATIWSYDGMAGPIKMSPVVYGGRIYFGDTEGVFQVLNERTGKLIHSVSFHASFSCSPPVIVGKTLFIAAGSDIVAMSLPVLEPQNAVEYRAQDDIPLYINEVRQ